MNQAQLLRAVGECLYGPRWQTDIAATLDVSDRTVRRWASGDFPMPTTIWADIARLLKAAQQAINGLVPEVLAQAVLSGKTAPSDMKATTMAQLTKVVLEKLRQQPGCDKVGWLSLYILIEPQGTRNWEVANVDTSNTPVGAIVSAVNAVHAELGPVYWATERD
jgi:hypothetical protein